MFTYSRITLSFKVATLLVATLALYYQDLIVLGNEAIKNELMSYMLVMPFMLAYLVYRKRKMLRAIISLENPVPRGRTIIVEEFCGALLCLTAFLLYWFGSYTFYPLEYHIVSLPIFIAGCILLMFSASTLKVFGFPVFFLLFLTPLPSELAYFLGSTLSTFSSDVAHAILRTIGLPVSLVYQYGTPTIILEKSSGLPLTFAIDIACAGIYSIVGFGIFATFIVYIARGTLRKKAAVFFTGFPLLYGLNIIRIVAIVLIGYQYGIEVAMQVFHLLGGWVLIFMGTLVLLFLSEKVFKIRLFTNTPRLSTCDYCSQNRSSLHCFCPSCGKLQNPLNARLSKRDLGKIVALMISSILIINLQAPAFTLTEGPAQVTIQTLGNEESITQILPEFAPEYTTKFIYRDREFEKIAQQDASLTYAYYSSQDTIWVTLEIAETKYSLHPWEACLITYRVRAPPVTKLSQIDVQLLENPPLVGRFFAFRDTQTNAVRVILYWFEIALFETGSSIRQKHVKISLITSVDSPEDILEAEEKLLPFGKAIVNYWQPIKEWSQFSLAIGQVALGISKHGTTFIIALTSLLAAVLVPHVVKNRKKEKSNFQAYNKLSLKEDKLIMQAVHQAAKEVKPTSTAIALAYQRLSGKPIELAVLNQKLEKACEAGLVRKEIGSQEDEAILIWRSLIGFPKQRYGPHQHGIFKRWIKRN